MSSRTPRLASYEIVDDLHAAMRRGVEVVVHLADGQIRWCFFMTPDALASCGDWLPGTRIRFHPGVAHMLVVAQLDDDVVRLALEELDRRGELVDHTVLVDA